MKISKRWEMITKTWLIAIALCLGLSVQPAAAQRSARAVTLDFDGLTSGDILTNQFQDKGVIFSHKFDLTNGAVVGVSGDFQTFPFGNSEPNFVIVGLGALTANFVDPLTGEPSSVTFLQVRIGDGDLAPEAIGVTAFDLEGNLLTSQVMHLIDAGTTLTMTSPAATGISEVRIFGIEVMEGNGFAIDDFTFNR